MADDRHREVVGKVRHPVESVGFDKTVHQIHGDHTEFGSKSFHVSRHHRRHHDGLQQSVQFSIGRERDALVASVHHLVQADAVRGVEVIRAAKDPAGVVVSSDGKYVVRLQSHHRTG